MLFFAASLWQTVANYAANILLSDQWGVYPALAPLSLMEIFGLQQGPHRRGLGGLATAAVLHLTAWDARLESQITAAVLIVAAILGLVLKARVIGPLAAIDLVIPTLLLTHAQYEWMIIAPYPGAGVIPLALLLAYLVVLTLDNPRVRFPLALITATTTVYTGYGIVFAPLFPIALVLSSWRRPGEFRIAACLAGVMAALEATVFIGFHRLSSAFNGILARTAPRWPGGRMGRCT